MKNARILLLSLLCPACPAMENTEEIIVRPDGSLHVVVRAEGPPSDLADGYPVPLASPWTPVGESTRAWLDGVGPDTGGPETRRAVAAGRADALGDRDVTLGAQATLADPSEWPERTAPADVSGAEGWARRSVRLDVRRVGRRTVYAFTRTFHAPGLGELNLARLFREGGAWSSDAPFFERVPKDLLAKDEDELTPADWERWAAILREVFADVARSHGHDVALSVFTEGDASLDPALVAEISAAAERGVTALLTTPRLRALWLDEEDDGWERFQRDARAALRASLEAALADAGASPAAQQTARERLDRIFAGVDQENDLWGEAFSVSVRMPGTITGGNFEVLSGGRALWSFGGDELVERDVVLRVVSVVE